MMVINAWGVAGWMEAPSSVFSRFRFCVRLVCLPWFGFSSVLSPFSVAFSGFYKSRGWPLLMCSCLTIVWHERSVSLRRNREITVLLLLGCSTWPLEDNGQLRRRLWESWSKTVLVSCWIGPWSGNEEDDEQWFKTVPFVSLEMAIGPWTYDI